MTAGATSIAAPNGPPFALSSVVPSPPRSISVRPRREKPATMPGVTHLPLRVDHLRAVRDCDVDAGRGDPAVADDDGAARDRLGPVAERDRPAGDGDGLRGKRAALQLRSSAATSEPDHFTSPSPGWPSSKSLTGRSRGLPLKYISAPSIHTRSGRA